MTPSDLSAWLAAYGMAWEARDPAAAGRLFALDATYQETPFGPPARGREGIERYWAEATKGQTGITFSNEILSLAGNQGIARWWAEYTRLHSRVRVRLDGIFLLEFDEQGCCRRLLEWWHRTERHPEDELA